MLKQGSFADTQDPRSPILISARHKFSGSVWLPDRSKSRLKSVNTRQIIVT